VPTTRYPNALYALLKGLVPGRLVGAASLGKHAVDRCDWPTFGDGQVHRRRARRHAVL